jgi:hypothetical protein
MKFFDYKFMIMLGLTMVVYFLYREIDTINKRVGILEKNTNPNTNQNNIEDVCELPLPLPPMPRNNKTVEMYSNDMIYSNDMMDSDTNEHDTMMVESLVDMTNNNKIDTSTSEEDIFVENDISESSCDNISSSVINNELSQLPTKKISPKSPISSISPKTPIVIQSNESNDNLDNLLKNKLVELQEIATSNGISLTLEGSTKKKTKQQLAQDIHNKKKTDSKL